MRTIYVFLVYVIEIPAKLIINNKFLSHGLFIWQIF